MQKILDELKEEIREIKGCFLMDGEGRIIALKSLELSERKKILQSLHYLITTVREKKADVKKLFLEVDNGKIVVYNFNQVSLGIYASKSLNPVMLDMIVKNKKIGIEKVAKSLEMEKKLKDLEPKMKEIAFKKLGGIGETIVERELKKAFESEERVERAEIFLENIKKSASLLVGPTKAGETVEEIKKILGGEEIG